jgi:hypothetical protein
MSSENINDKIHNEVNAVQDPTAYSPNYSEIWSKLSVINCEDKVEKKMGLSFLSWAWAWDKVMEVYPNAQYYFYEDKNTHVPYVRYPDGSAEVRCTVIIGHCVREMWLPVMDYKNNAITEPNSRQVSDTKMRCLVKCLAMFGLGHHIYAGEDVPKQKSTTQKEDKSAKASKNLDQSNISTQAATTQRGKNSENDDSSPSKDLQEETVDWKLAPNETQMEEGAKMWKDGFISSLTLFKTKEEVNGQWLNEENRPNITFMEKKFPEIYREMVNAIKDYVSKLPQEEKDGKDTK